MNKKINFEKNFKKWHFFVDNKKNSGIMLAVK